MPVDILDADPSSDGMHPLHLSFASMTHVLDNLQPSVHYRPRIRGSVAGAVLRGQCCGGSVAGAAVWAEMLEDFSAEVVHTTMTCYT